MKKLLSLLVLLLCASALAQLPPLVRNPYNTNNAHIATNTLYLSELMGSDTAGAWQWGNPAMPVKTLTNALMQAQISCLNGAATIFAYPESYACSNMLGISITNLNLTLIAQGATFNCWITNTPHYIIEVNTNAIFRQIGGTWDYVTLPGLTAYTTINQGHPIDGTDSTNIYLSGVTVKAVGDNFFWTTHAISKFKFENCDFSSAWDMNQISMTGPGTNSVFEWKNCVFRKDAQEMAGAATWSCVNLGYVGVANFESCAFLGDAVGNFTNAMTCVRPARTNSMINCSWSLISSGAVTPLDALTTGGATPRRYRFINCHFYPDYNINLSESANTKLQFGVSTVSNITVRAEVILETNTTAAWPPAPVLARGGQAVLVNSNGYIYLLQSGPASGAWTSTNLLGATP